MLPTEVIDNSENNKLVGFLKEALNDNQDTQFDIATAFFDIKAFGMIQDELNGIKRFRLLLGKVPDIETDQTLGDILKEKLVDEIEDFDLTRSNDEMVTSFIEFLKQEYVEVRLFEKFLHGKTYIFQDRAVSGSSNFTAAGLTRYGELNQWGMKSIADYLRKEWFEKFWDQSKDFKEELTELFESSRFGSHKYTPYEIYIKSLFELQKEDIKIQENDGKDLDSLVNLVEFQEDAVHRVLSRLKKYGGVIVADSVGLGKTYIALKVIEYFHLQNRKNRTLIVCPAQIRDLMWRKELKDKVLPEHILSQEEIGSENYLEKAKEAVGDHLDEIELIVVDESHNFRNPLSNRWEHLFELINDHISTESKKPKILFLTATPINNSPWDLYWQIMLLFSMNRATFIKENIPDLQEFFRKVESDPSLLNDLLNEISIRRTRDYIIKNYPETYIGEGENKQKIVFPERALENINYELDKTYKGMYKEIADIISDKLTMAYYRMLEYRKEEPQTEEEVMQLGRMISIGGIFRTMLLKRLESSVDSFRISIGRQVKFLESLKEALKHGKTFGKMEFNKLLKKVDSLSLDDVEEYLDKFGNLEGIEFSDFNKDKYHFEELCEDIDVDIRLLNQILNKVNTIKPVDDAKLNVLKEKLLELSKDGQIVLFAYYADTLNYIYQAIIEDPRFSNLNIQAISSSGQTSKNPSQRGKILEEFSSGKTNILISTDVLSEGQNLQSAKYLINYDLHWNPTRMVQRAGRIDRIGSKYEKIYIYNFFPEKELEELLNLLKILQYKITNINDSLGLDGTILGEPIKPKVFGIIRAIKDKDKNVFKELEEDSFAGGEMFYQPLKDFMREQAIEEIEQIPYGVHSGLKNGSITGIFFYYKYADDFNYWYLYDINSEEIITNKTEISQFIACDSKGTRYIPHFFEKVYDINSYILEDIERNYKNMEAQTQENKWDISPSTKFLKKMMDALDYEVNEHLMEYPADEKVEKQLKRVQEKLGYAPLTKKRLQTLRKIQKEFKKDYDWNKTLQNLDDFLKDKETYNNNRMDPFDKSELKLVTIDFIS